MVGVLPLKPSERASQEPEWAELALRVSSVLLSSQMVTEMQDPDPIAPMGPWSRTP